MTVTLRFSALFEERVSRMYLSAFPLSALGGAVVHCAHINFVNRTVNPIYKVPNTRSHLFGELVQCYASPRWLVVNAEFSDVDCLDL